MTTESTATAPAGGAPTLTGPRASAIAARTRAGRDEAKAAFLAGDDETRAVEEHAKVEEPKPTDATDAVDPDAETEDGDEKPDEKPDDKADEPKPDAETAKRLAAVQAAEKRSREKLAKDRTEWEATRDAERKEIDTARAELETVKAEVARYRKAVERAEVDPLGLLHALGIKDPKKLDYAAKQIYAATKDDPNNREAAARAMRERERDDDVGELRRELKALREERQAEKQQATVQQHATAFMESVVKQAGAAEDAPLLRTAMTKSPAATKQQLARIAVELANEAGDYSEVTAEDVIARYEKTRRAQLEELGLTPDSILKTEQKKPDPEATKKTVAKTLGNDLSTQRVPRPSSSEREQRAEARAEFVKNG